MAHSGSQSSLPKESAGMRCSSWLTYKVHGWIQRFSRPFPCTTKFTTFF